MSNYSWYEEGSEVSPFKSVPPSSLGPKGSKVIPFSLSKLHEFDQPYKQAESKMQVTGKISSNK